MVIVIIHWKIHPHDSARDDFFKYWRESLEIPERANLIGEFLSKPLTKDEAGFVCDLMNVPEAAAMKYQSYFNVGLWCSKEDFYAQVVEPFVERKIETKPFEYEYRQRMVLDPASWRAGKYDLPAEDHHFAP